MQKWTSDRTLHRSIVNEKPSASQRPRDTKQIVIPMTWSQDDQIWHDNEGLRAFVAESALSAPDLFPDGFEQGYHLHGFDYR
jgi:hypothetical protein